VLTKYTSCWVFVFLLEKNVFSTGLDRHGVYSA